MKRRVLNYIIILFLLIGLGLIGKYFHDGYINKYILSSKIQEAIYSEAMEPIDKVYDEEKPTLVPEYGADAIKSVEELNMKTYKKFEEEIMKTRSSGRIIIPSIRLDLGVYQGINNANLIKGAAEQLPREHVSMGGHGNYILASHNTRLHGVLFNYINNVSKNDEIFLFNHQKMYVYQADIIDKINVHDKKWLTQPEHSTEKLITLYTCDQAVLNTDYRYIVRGHLINEYNKNNIPMKYKDIIVNSITNTSN